MKNYVNNLFSLNGKVAIVTGASKGIGNSIATGLSKAGAEVYGLARSLEHPEKEIPYNYISCNVTDLDSVKKVVKNIYLEESKIDILINAAGITLANENKSMAEIVNNFEQTLACNLNAPFNVIQIISEYMKQSGGGSIINITSIASEFGFSNNPGYVASKGGLRLLSKALAEDLAKYNIRVNNIAPGYIHTEMTDKSYQNKEQNEIRLRNTMLNRWGEPDDMIGASIFLASDSSSYVTGADIFVDGGWSAKGMS